MLDFTGIKLGKAIVFNNAPCVVIKCDFLRMQQRKPVKKCILRNLLTGANLEYSFKSGETVEEADLARQAATFMYADGQNLNFMLTRTFETVELPTEILGDKVDYLREELEVQILYFNDNPISVELPVKVSYLVTEAQEVAKGNTVSNLLKDVKIETGKIVKAPAFIKVGDRILVNTIEDEYAERDTAK